MSSMNLPNDGPATEFEADLHIEQLLISDPKTMGDNFGLVVVCAWPPPTKILQQNYETFLQGVRDCFESSTDHDRTPDIYLYPESCLHITIATFRAFTHPKPSSMELQQQMMDEWKSLLWSASCRPGWPGNEENVSKKHKFRFQLDRAQIGKKAGILLWKETTGNLERVRNMIQMEFECRKKAMSVAVQENVESTFTIPSIVHSTFLRFRKNSINGTHVQQKFQSQFLSPYCETTNQTKLQKLFETSTMEVDTIYLVNERTPYMHIPKDDNHILATITLP